MWTQVPAAGVDTGWTRDTVLVWTQVPGRRTCACVVLGRELGSILNPSWAGGGCWDRLEERGGWWTHRWTHQLEVDPSVDRVDCAHQLELAPGQWRQGEVWA